MLLHTYIYINTCIYFYMCIPLCTFVFVLCKVNEAEKKRRFIFIVKFEDMKCFMLMLGIKSET